MSDITEKLSRYLNDCKKYKAQYYQVELNFLERILEKMQEDEELIEVLRLQRSIAFAN